jgi:hypothetical protein
MFQVSTVGPALPDPSQICLAIWAGAPMLGAPMLGAPMLGAPRLGAPRLGTPLGAAPWCSRSVLPLALRQALAGTQAPRTKAPLARKHGIGARLLRASGGLAQGVCREAGLWRFVSLLGVTSLSFLLDAPNHAHALKNRGSIKWKTI